MTAESLEPRERAFMALYRADQLRIDTVEGLTGRAERLAVGTLRHLDEIDRHIDGAAEHWTVDRMPAVDRALLRLATYELAHEPDTPTGVILNESVRIAKEYSTENSGRFINGILATLSKLLRS
ncbi:MAG TPA: transcription antitermination factor NusB [Acidimicrobiia bacterium]